MNSPSEQNTSDSLLQALLEKNTQDLAEIQLKPYTPTVYAIPDTIWTAMVNLLQNAATFQPTLYQKLQPLATWEGGGGNHHVCNRRDFAAAWLLQLSVFVADTDCQCIGGRADHQRAVHQ